MNNTKRFNIIDADTMCYSIVSLGSLGRISCRDQISPLQDKGGNINRSYAVTMCSQFTLRTTEDFDRWVPVYKGTRKAIINKLTEDGYLEKVSRSLSKRADFFRYSKGIFYIYESKNKELSGLNFKDLITTLFYPLVLRRCGYDVKELKIIFNGDWTDDLAEQINKGFTDKFDFKVKFVPIKAYLEDENIYVKSIQVNYVDGKYEYEIIYGNSDKITIEINDKIQ